MAERSVKFDRMEQLISLFGSFDENIRLLEEEYHVKITTRGDEIKLVGDTEDTARAARAIGALLVLSEKGEGINEQSVRYVMGLVGEGYEERIRELGGDCIAISVRGRPVKPKTIGQKEYVEAIRTNTIVMGEGPAGTGKTYLAVAMAANALRSKEVSKIVLTRPAVEAGESLGFLPGDLQNKIDPYLRPLYDALYDMFGAESCVKYIERGVIEIAPLAYMRGRTLDDSFIILDEAQNTTPEQMKMFLTRLGIHSKAVITGDTTQIDLPATKRSGMKDAMRILRGIDDIQIVTLTNKDVVRNPLVQQIIKAYEKQERGGK